MTVKQDQQAWADWINTEQWDIFGTLNFASLHHLARADRNDVCGKVWRSFFGEADRALYGQQRKQQTRFDRAVFVQYGANGTNPHVHFVAKSPIPADQFCILLNALWASMYDFAAKPASNQITPILQQARTTGYGLHEFYRLNSETYDYRLSTTGNITMHQSVRVDAADRLTKRSNPAYLLQAQFTFPAHLQVTTRHT